MKIFRIFVFFGAQNPPKIVGHETLQTGFVGHGTFYIGFVSRENFKTVFAGHEIFQWMLKMKLVPSGDKYNWLLPYQYPILYFSVFVCLLFVRYHFSRQPLNHLLSNLAWVFIMLRCSQLSILVYGGCSVSKLVPFSGKGPFPGLLKKSGPFLVPFLAIWSLFFNLVPLSTDEFIEYYFSLF